MNRTCKDIFYGKIGAQTVTDKFLGYVFTTEFPMALNRNPLNQLKPPGPFGTINQRVWSLNMTSKKPESCQGTKAVFG